MTRARATIEDLHRVAGKAEIANGEIRLLTPAGGAPGYAADTCRIASRSVPTRRSTSVLSPGWSFTKREVEMRCPSGLNRESSRRP
jgi:hypothetical protein